MNKKDHPYSRRDFFKITGAAGIASILGWMDNTTRASGAVETFSGRHQG